MTPGLAASMDHSSARSTVASLSVSSPSGRHPRSPLRPGSATLQVYVGTMAGVALGFARDVSLSAKFGTTFQSDAYFLAFALPTFVWLSMSTVLQSVFIPLYASLEVRSGVDDARAFARGGILFLSAAFGALALVYAVATPQLLQLFDRGRTDQTYLLAVKLSHVMAPILVLSVLSSLFSCLLYLNGQYLLPAFASSLLNGAILVGVFYPGASISAVAVGTVAGFLLQVLVFFVALCLNDHSYRHWRRGP